jgi:hypothetical protein
MKVSKSKRAYRAGKAQGESIREIVHLLYQERTALGYVTGLKEEVDKLFEERQASHRKMLDRECQRRKINSAKKAT